MNKKHEKKQTIHLVIGFILTTIGISAISYIAFETDPRFDWVFWAIFSSVVINGGLFFLGSAAVHKVKADLIRKQKQKSRTSASLAQSE
jgi:divalent metal cation (Fe/Co/Zn/Cd) transporter